MLRELEIASMTSRDVSFDAKERTVTLTLMVSKTDTAAGTVSRTLQCLCQEGCDLRCPFAVLEALVNKAMLRGTKEAFLAYTREGWPATKAEVVTDWQTLFGSGITGHSARRSGALQYIRKGWSVPQVAYLGRWKSNIILQYAQEALESMALNNQQKFGHPVFEANEAGVEKDVASLANMLRGTSSTEPKNDEATVLFESLKAELSKFRQHEGCNIEAQSRHG